MIKTFRTCNLIILYFLLMSSLFALSPTSFFGDKKLKEILKNWDFKILNYEILEGGNCPEKPILLITSKGKFVFKLLSKKLCDIQYFTKLNEHLNRNNVNIHHVIHTKNNELYIEIDNKYYVMLEYFEDFKTKEYEHIDFKQLGILAAQIFNASLTFHTDFMRTYKDRAAVLVKFTDSKINKLIQNFNALKHYFLASNMHNDLHYRNVDTKFRVIDLGIAQYDYRINEFMNIFFGSPDMTSFLKISVFDILNCILGYNSIAKIELNFFELSGIMLVLKSRLYEDMLSRKNHYDIQEFYILEKLYYAA